MNNYNITGNLGRDVEVKHMGGTTLAEFAVAVKAGYGDREQTLWISCQLWGKRAEGGIVDYLKKGQQVGVNGELSTNEWTTNDGEQRTTLRLRVDDVTLLGNSGGNVQQGASQAVSDKGNEVAGNGAVNNFDDDVPF